MRDVRGAIASVMLGVRLRGRMLCCNSNPKGLLRRSLDFIHSTISNQPFLLEPIKSF